ncbi:MAG: 4-(cytidine 5'-diphospho)-2-C-methyl-D-erythritol kinase [Oscillospiraceae bacterium]
MKTIVVKVPAKLNLTLDITGRREDGYHFMQMVMQAVDLYDTLTLTRLEHQRVDVTCNKPELSCGEDNLVRRAAVLFFEHTGIRAGTAIEIQKVIPMQAGLGGGSADAAGTLTGLNALFGTGLSTQELCALGLTLGADVPFCIRGGTALAQGIGEIFTELPRMPECSIVIAKPVENMSTAVGFARFDEHGARRRPDHDKVVAGIAAGDLEYLTQGMYNVMEEVYGLSAVSSIEEDMLRHGAVKAMMTGSGTAVFGIFGQRSKAKRCLKSLMGSVQAVFLAQPVDHGPVLLKK